MEEAQLVSEVNNEELVNELQEVAEANAKRNPEEIAAGFFMQYYPSYKVLLGRLNRKDAVRLADALVAWPLEIQTPKFANSEGDIAFRLGLQLIDCKMIMRNALEMEAMQEAANKQTDNGETNNG